MGAYDRYMEEEDLPTCFSDPDEYSDRDQICRHCPHEANCRREIVLAEARTRRYAPTRSATATGTSTPFRSSTATASSYIGARTVSGVVQQGGRIILRLEENPTPLAGEAFGEVVSSGIAEMLGESSRLVRTLKIGPGGVVSSMIAAALGTGDQYLQVRRFRFGVPKKWNSKLRCYEDVDDG